MAAADRILLKCDRTKFANLGGHVELNQHWAHSLLTWMKFVQRNAITATSKQINAEFAELKKSFLDDVVVTVTMENIPPELVLNWDQTGIKMDQQGAKWVVMVGVSAKRQITAVFCGTLLGDFLPVQVIYKGKTPRCHPCFEFLSG